MKHCKQKNKEVIIRHFTNSKELPKEWDDLVPPSHFLHTSNLAVTEQSNLDNISFLYIMCLKGDEVLITTAFQVLTLSKEHLNKEMSSPFQYFGWQLYTSSLSPKLLVAGHLFRHDVWSVYCNGNLGSFEEYTLYKKAIDRALHVSCASAVLIKDMPEKLSEYFQNFAPKYLQLRNDISMEMSIDTNWVDINDYEEALKHKYAQRFRKVRKSWDEIQVKELSVQEVEEKKNEIFQLYHQVAAHQQVRIGLLSIDFIPQLKRNYDSQLKVWGMYKEEQLIGFFSAWVLPHAFDMFYIGFEYEKNRELNLYFNILFFSIEQAIKLQKQKLILGRTALDAKARLGCKPKYLHTFIYVRNKLVRDRVIQIQSNSSNKEGAWESRHPFKNQS